MSSTEAVNNNNDEECPTTPVKPREDQAFVTAAKALKRDEPAVSGKVVKRRRRKRNNGDVIATKPKTKKNAKGVRIVTHRVVFLETDPPQLRIEYDIEVFTKDQCNRITSLTEEHARLYGVTTKQLNSYKIKYNFDEATYTLRHAE